MRLLVAILPSHLFLVRVDIITTYCLDINGEMATIVMRSQIVTNEDMERYE